jgi:hypothetical protein
MGRLPAADEIGGCDYIRVSARAYQRPKHTGGSAAARAARSLSVLETLAPIRAAFNEMQPCAPQQLWNEDDD